jgi:hypothetical protein
MRYHPGLDLGRGLAYRARSVAAGIARRAINGQEQGMSEQPSAAPPPARTSPAASQPAQLASMDADLAAAWRGLAAGARLLGAFAAGATATDGPLTLFLELGAVPPPLAGRRLRLCLGEDSVLAVPLRASHAPVEFGPVRLTLDEALRFAGLPPRLMIQGAPPLSPGRLVGAPLEAMGIATEAAFFDKVQNTFTRYADPMLLRLGARAGYRMPGFAPRAAALTVLSHRVLERDLHALSPRDQAEITWLRQEGRGVVEEGLALLAASPPDAGPPDAGTVRWTTSLGTACALLALCQDDAEAAIFHFGAAAAQVPHVRVAPVAALNLVQACLLQGVLLGLTGRPEAARGPLEQGLRAFPPCVAAQELMANVRVIGDLITAGRAARLCFVALDRFGLLETRGTPRIHPGTRLDLGQLGSPFPRILAAGLCPGIAGALARLDPPAAAPAARP